jgi:hypothetical protein
MKSPSRHWLRPGHGSLLVRLAGLGVALVLAIGLGAGIAFVSQGGLSFPGGSELLRADATTSIEDATSAHDIGVWYDAEARRWAIFNQNLTPMTQGMDHAT